MQPQQPQQGYPLQPYAGGYPPTPPPVQGPAPSPRLQEALGQVDLLPGEGVVYTLQADGFYLGSSPILKMIAAIQAFMVMITGGHIRIFLVVTNQRVLVLKSIQMWCGCNRLKAMHTIALAGVKEAGTAKATALCCINTRVVHVASMTQNYTLVVKKLSDQEIRAFVTNLAGVIVAHSTRAGV